MGDIVELMPFINRKRGVYTTPEDARRMRGFIRWKIDNWRGMEEAVARKREQRARRNKVKRPHRPGPF